jgi:hypothetical protein
MKKHSWSAVTHSFLIAAYAMQVTILSNGLWSQVFWNEFEKIPCAFTELNANSIICDPFDLTKESIH